MFIIYDLAFLLFTLLYLPVFLLKKKYHSGFLSRLGIFQLKSDLNRPIWVHAVSVGEAISVKKLVEELRLKYPDKKIVISTVTATGNSVVKSFCSKDGYITFLPLDFSFIVKPVIDKINPSLFIIAETEIWPNLISYLFKKKIPVVIVNGRISDKSFKGYKIIESFIKPVFSKISLFCVQSKTDAKRFVFLGANENKVHVTGNVKFDSVNLKEVADSVALKESLWLAKEDKLLIAGSTHPQEEEMLLKIYSKLLNDFGNLKLLIAPRHPERSEEISRIVSSEGFKPVLISKREKACKTCIPKPVFILDTIGSLRDFYSIADIVFIGGSFIKKGGHNIIEPAFFSKPVVFGPNMFNFRDITEVFLKAKAAVMVFSAKELLEEINFLIKDSTKAKVLGDNAKSLILENQGATERNLRLIERLINES